MPLYLLACIRQLTATPALYFFIIFLPSNINAQLGFIPSYSTNRLITMEAAENLKSKLPAPFGLSLDYRFKHPNYRIYYGPEIGWNYYGISFDKLIAGSLTNITKEAHLFSLGTRFSFYPLNIEGDCNCPTFTRENPFFKRGLYVIIDPKINFAKLHTNNTIGSETEQIPLLTFLSINGGLGLDIGLSEKLTVTPEVFISQIVPLATDQKEYDHHFNTRLYFIGDIRLEYRFLSDKWH